MRRFGLLVAFLALLCVAAESAKPKPKPEKPKVGPNEQAVMDLLKSVGIEEPGAQDILDKFVVLSDGRIRADDPYEEKAAFFMANLQANIRTFVVENYVKALAVSETQALQRKRTAAARVFKIN